MPLVKISMIRGNSRETKELISLEIHNALVDTFQVDDADFNHRIFEFDRENWQLPHGRSDSFILVDIDIYPGRSPEMKKSLFAEIVKRLGTLKFPPEDILVHLNEQPLENWGIRGGIPATEIHKRR